MSKAPEYLPDSLRVLEWWRYPLEELPSDFNPNQLTICNVSNKGIMSPELAELPEDSQSGPQVLRASLIVPNVSRSSQSGIEVLQAFSLSVLGVSQTLSSAHKLFQILQRVYENNKTWRIVGLLSSAVGLSCFALSPSFIRLIRGWKPWKFFLYVVFSLVVLTIVLFLKQSSAPTRYLRYKITGFVGLMLIAVYTFYYDKAVNGKPEILSLFSNAAFALMSFSLSKLTKYGRAKGLFSFFLSCLVVQLLTINWKLIFVAILFGCPLFFMYSNSDPRIPLHNS